MRLHFQEQVMFLLCPEFDEEVLISFFSLVTLSLSLLSLSWHLYLSLCQHYQDGGNIQSQGVMGPDLWWG